MIPKTVLQGLADRAASQVALFITAIDASGATGGGKFYPRIHGGIPTTGLFGTEDDLISSANSLDTSKISTSQILPDIYRDIVNDLNSHAANENMTDFNTLLSGLSLNITPNFDTAWHSVRGAHLWGENVLADEVVSLGTVAFTDSGVATFTNGSAMGSGSHAVTSATNRAAAMLHAKPTLLVGGTDIILDVRLTNESDVATSRNVTIPAGTAADTLVSVGTSGTDFFRDVTNVVVAGGTNGDNVVIQSAIERVEAL